MGARLCLPSTARQDVDDGDEHVHPSSAARAGSGSAAAAPSAQLTAAHQYQKRLRERKEAAARHQLRTADAAADAKDLEAALSAVMCEDDPLPLGYLLLLDASAEGDPMQVIATFWGNFAAGKIRNATEEALAVKLACHGFQRSLEHSKVVKNLCDDGGYGSGADADKRKHDDAEFIQDLSKSGYQIIEKAARRAAQQYQQEEEDREQEMLLARVARANGLHDAPQPQHHQNGAINNNTNTPLPVPDHASILNQAA